MVRIRRRHGVRVAALLLLLALLLPVPPARQARADTAFGSDHFQRTWAYTDQPVAAGQVSRTWMWGPQAFSQALVEPYWDSPTGWRLVQYVDKTRMEITNPGGDQSSLWYVTNGLLAKELITGQMQVGDDKFVQYPPAQVNVAGDTNDPNGPTYATFNDLMGYGALPNGWTLIQTVDRAGTVGADVSLASYGVSAVDVGAPTHHNVASVFWSFMTSTGPVEQNGQTTSDKLFQNPFYATGYPLTEAYWTHVLVGGVQKLVLVQVFERRVLTYTPNNPTGWQVEAGNVGQHYYTWRYQQLGLPVMTLLDLTSTAPSAHSCQPYQYAERRYSVSQYYGQPVTLAYQGTDCNVFDPANGVLWDTITGTAQIYKGNQVTGTPIDTRPFTWFVISRDPTNYAGWPPPSFESTQCGAVQFYERGTVAGAVESIIRYSDGIWDSSGQAFTNPVKTFDFPTPCLQPPGTAPTNLGVPGDLRIYFNARLEPNSIPGDPQGQVSYLFVVSGADLSTVNVSQVIQGPPESTPVYHGGNLVFLYLSPSMPPGQQTVTIKLPDGRQSSTSFTIPADDRQSAGDGNCLCPARSDSVVRREHRLHHQLRCQRNVPYPDPWLRIDGLATDGGELRRRECQPRHSPGYRGRQRLRVPDDACDRPVPKQPARLLPPRERRDGRQQTGPELAGADPGPCAAAGHQRRDRLEHADRRVQGESVLVLRERHADRLGPAQHQPHGQGRLLGSEQRRRNHRVGVQEPGREGGAVAEVSAPLGQGVGIARPIRRGRASSAPSGRPTHWARSVGAPSGGRHAGTWICGGHHGSGRGWATSRRSTGEAVESVGRGGERTPMMPDAKSQSAGGRGLAERSATEREELKWTLTCTGCGTAWTITHADITAGGAWASCSHCHRRMTLKEIGASMLGGAGR